MALTKEEILDGIAALTVLELKELLDAFEEKFGVTAAAPVAGAAGGAGGAAPPVHHQYLGVESRAVSRRRTRTLFVRVTR